MCGIFAYAGARPAAGLLANALARLEYRGYDSAGVATLHAGRIHVVKLSGRIDALHRRLARSSPPGACGMGHTRWATHGAPSDANAHPHLDCRGDLAIIHNGIVENFLPLCRRLARRGHRLRSQTDSELIAHLLEERYRGSLSTALREVARMLEGQFVIVAVTRHEPGRVAGIRYGPPLVAGYGEGEHFLTSDIAALLPHTRSFLPLEDGECAEIAAEGVRVLDAAGRGVHRKARTADWSVEQARKEGYDTFMLKEIHEQPRALSDTLRDRVSPKGTGGMAGEAGLDSLPLRRAERVHLVACGTAWHAALVGRHWFHAVARLAASADVASEFRYAPPPLGPRTLVVAVSQSGETADTLAAVRLARYCGARVLAVCNVVGSSIARASDGVLYTRAGPEIGVASTKAYTTQLVAIMLLALHAGVIRGATPTALRRALLAGILRTPSLARAALRAAPAARRIARRLNRAPGVLYIGRDVNGATALEGALKLKEISYLHAEGYLGGEMKHGPLALIQPGVPVVAIAPDGPVHPKMLSNIQEARARGARVVAVATAGNREIRRFAPDVLPIPPCHPLVTPIPAVIPLQCLAYETARLRGCDIDRPRNLAKSVTVE